ncbi:MAG: hypothetical protein EAZ16_04500 [Sphingobacteriales bacterium]|nr:MAG: hypothetical protein EAZ16_04500 [Sphingobacteriales bacterium]
MHIASFLHCKDKLKLLKIFLLQVFNKQNLYQFCLQVNFVSDKCKVLGVLCAKNKPRCGNNGTFG